MWPQGMTPSTGPTLLTRVKLGNEDNLVDDLMEWEGKFENASLHNHTQFLRNAQLTAGNHPMEAAAWENGYVPEAQGLPSDQLESRIQGSLPPLAYMVSRPRQPIATGEGLLRRFDAGVRPYWLRDWQSGFGGYTKVYEYQVRRRQRRSYLKIRSCTVSSDLKDELAQKTAENALCLRSDLTVQDRILKIRSLASLGWRRDTKMFLRCTCGSSENEFYKCRGLCFTLMSKLPGRKPWKRAPEVSSWTSKRSATGKCRRQ